ncbi:hypothetical protein FACS1894195_2320 [Bacteroidia bacterium]|nr:hypothetical protein FACS1894195_2320 [Bacteroidia bacterium]
MKDIQFSNIPRAEMYFHLTAKNLQITAIPQDEQYRFVWVEVKGHKEQIGERENGSVTINLPPLKNGRYKVEVYFASEHYSKYRSWILRGLYLLVSNGSFSFECPKTLDSNKAVMARNPSPQNYLSADKDIDSKSPAIVALAQKIAAGKSSDYDKAMAVHDWVASNIYYDYDALYSTKNPSCSASETLRTKRSVCQGYASLSAALLRSLGIPCRVVTGFGLGVGTNGEWDKVSLGNNSNHAWNEFYANGRWVIMDATWDSDMEYRRKKFDKKEGLRGHRYFDINIEAFSLDHRIM